MQAEKYKGSPVALVILGLLVAAIAGSMGTMVQKVYSTAVANRPKPVETLPATCIEALSLAD
ncbi:hypothetical protein [Arthrobacter sp. ZGTC131]|uniref:hypothetical protein n=1 Tax=Arthrobacter sp. ZGTC131 TaxID=2058898 RepID=UPI000CE39C91|nr:hypothetical protein [Arthrobacter sp. ZGTC131]